MNDIFQKIKYLDFHTHQQRHVDSEVILEIVSLHLGQEKEVGYFTVGLHPWWVEHPLSPTQRQDLLAVLTNPYCLAMGEMGLDNLKGASIELQMDILRSQLRIAEQLHKPVIIHCVRAYDQLIKLKKEFPRIDKWCIHGYGRHGILAKQLVDQGFYLSLMPSLPSNKYQDLLQAIPMNRLFLETDSMADVSIAEIYSTVSHLSGIEMHKLCEQLKCNARDFFKI